jgi:tetratricopeptide (TPR) repeat protein
MDGELHFSADLVSAYEDGVISADHVFRIVLGHLETCSRCAEEMDRWRASAPEAQTLPLFALVRRGTFVTPEAERKQAEEEFDELLSIPSVDERFRRVRRANKRFSSPYLAERLLYEGWEELVALDRDASRSLVELSELVLDNDKENPRSRELRVFSRSLLAACSKASGDFEKARVLFAESREITQEAPLSDVTLLGHLEFLEGSFLKDRRELVAAEARLRLALRLYKIVGDAPSIARTRLTLGLCVFHAGRAEEAARITEGALHVLDRDQDLLLYFYAEHNITMFLSEAGRAQEAAARLKANLDLYTEIAKRIPLVTGHFHWLAGKIRRGLGEGASAITHLTKARNLFLQKGTRYEVVLICLDMAFVYLESGDTRAVKELVAVMLPSYAVDGLHHEALAAVRLLAEAGKKEALTIPILREAYRFLEVSRGDTALSFADFRSADL